MSKPHSRRLVGAERTVAGLVLAFLSGCASAVDPSSTEHGGTINDPIGAPAVHVGGTIVTGANHTCAMIEGSGVKCWGDNSLGRLGLGDTASRGTRPGEMGRNLPVVDLNAAARVTSLGSGEPGAFTCVGFDSGDVSCWGGNGNGQLGAGDKDTRGDGPTEMGTNLGFVDFGEGRTAQRLALGGQHACALLDDDRVKCWGDAYIHGQLGIGEDTPRGDEPGEIGDALPAVDLGNLDHVIELAAGGVHSCAVFDSGDIKCWGDGSSGELGLGDTRILGDEAGEISEALPAVDLAGAHAFAVSAGSRSTCALLESGEVQCWGNNEAGQLGLGDSENRGDEPDEMGTHLPAVALGTDRTAVAIALGSLHACAILDSGEVKCWGDNSFGQLGLGDTQPRGDDASEMGDSLPAVDLGPDRTAVEIAAGGGHSCAWLDNGDLKCWGRNEWGQLGLEDAENRGDDPGEMGEALPAIDLGE